jgi:DNA-binding SARP family transcriptional activator
MVAIDAAEAEDLDVLINAGELLPAWYDDWVLIERERVRQMRLHALERACQELAASGRFGQAIEAGLAAIAEEPLRESAHRILISAHLAEGNRIEALWQFEEYSRLMRDELQLEPSIQIRGLIDGAFGNRSIMTGRLRSRRSYGPSGMPRRRSYD